MTVGERYILFVYDEMGRFQVSNCGNSGLVSTKQDVIKTVRQQKQINNKSMDNMRGKIVRANVSLGRYGVKMTKVSIFSFIWLLASVTYANDTSNQLPRQDIYKADATNIYEDYLNSVKLKDKLGSEHTLSAAEQRNIWLLTLGDFEYPPAAALRKDNVKDKYIKYDFSTLLTPKSEFLGYIAPNYHRMKIYFTSISKDPANAAIYMVSGISIVGNNKCYFKGKIEVDSIREFRVMHFGVDDEFKNTGIKVQGVLLGN